MKKLSAILLSLAMLVTVFSGTMLHAAAWLFPAPENTPAFAGGNGTVEKPFVIKTPEQLASIGNYNPEKNMDSRTHYVLGNDIDLAAYLAPGGAGHNNGAGWKPLGAFGNDSNGGLLGSLDGNGYVVRNIWCERSDAETPVGLFGIIDSATIQNLGLEIAPGKALRGNEQVGGIVGFANYIYLNQCYVIGSVEGSTVVGGLVGKKGFTGFYSSDYLIENCYMQGSVKGQYAVGGLIAQMSEGKVGYSYCAAKIEVDEYEMAGGIVSSRSGSTGLKDYVYRCCFDNEINQNAWTVFSYGDGPSTESSGLSTAEMKQKANYKGWDFIATWNANQGKSYPTLVRMESTGAFGGIRLILLKMLAVIFGIFQDIKITLFG